MNLHLGGSICLAPDRAYGVRNSHHSARLSRVAKWEGARFGYGVALFLSVLSPMTSPTDRRPEALSAPRIIRPFVSGLNSRT